jgi:hypothetical protein
MIMNKPKIYFAGKCGKEELGYGGKTFFNWRHEILPENALTVHVQYGDEVLEDSDLNVELAQFIYTGPFLVDNDNHGYSEVLGTEQK